MFLERIKFVGLVVLTIAGLFVLTAGIMWLFTAIHLFEAIDSGMVWLRTHNWIALYAVGLLILYGIGKFIYWLFIEPFRKKNRSM